MTLDKMTPQEIFKGYGKKYQMVGKLGLFWERITAVDDTTATIRDENLPSEIGTGKTRVVSLADFTEFDVWTR